MRAYVLSVLNSLSKDGKPIADDDIIAWANHKLSSSGKHTSIAHFKDKSISTGHSIIDLIDAIRPQSVNYSLVTAGSNESDQLNNAKLAISTGRKIGAVIFALPEDIVEVKPKMMLALLAALMAVDLGAQ